jgi:beta-N-acetylhexosaminidase
VNAAVLEVGQRILVGFDGLTPSLAIRELIRDFGVGHVLLCARNIESPEQVADLVRELQSLARQAGLDSPILVGTDQQGGAHSPLREPWTPWPPACALGRVGSEV